MRRNPLYVFENLDSTGIYKVPIESIIQINDADGNGTAMTLQVESKNGVYPGSTIREFMAKPENYSIPGEVNFIPKSLIDKPGGIPSLNAYGKISGDKLPSIRVGEIYTVNSDQEMINLNASAGDIVIRTDIPKSFINNGGNTGTVDDWIELSFPTGGVQSVNGKVGNVILTTDDVNEGLNNWYMTRSRFTQMLGQSEIGDIADVRNQVSTAASLNDVLTWNGTEWDAREIEFPVKSVNGKTQDIILTTDDIPEATNKYYNDALVDSRIQINIDDNAGAGNTSKLWSADKIFSELEYKAGTEDNILRGIHRIQNGGTNLDAALEIFNSKYSQSNLVVSFKSDKITWQDQDTGRRFIIRADKDNQKLGFLINDNASFTIAEGKPPATTYAPTEDTHLANKTYVDGIKTYVDNLYNNKLDLTGGTLTGDLIIEYNGIDVIKFTENLTTLNNLAVNTITEDLTVQGNLTLDGRFLTGLTDTRSEIAFRDTDAEGNYTDANPGLYWSNVEKVFKVTRNLNDQSQAYKILDSSYIMQSIEEIADPSAATAEEIATKINELITALKTSGLMQS